MLYAHRGVTGEADAYLRMNGMSWAHFRLLYMIALLPGITLRELVSTLEITHQGISRILNQLIADGYVRQEPDRADRRKRHLFLTDKGERIERAVFDRQAAVITRAFEGIGKAGVAIFLEAMDAMVSDSDRAIVDELRRSAEGLDRTKQSSAGRSSKRRAS
jgi:DNA-binding MarR family transcriptional regulator